MDNATEERRLATQQAAAGRRRWETADPQDAQSARAAGAAAINSPAGLARRLAAKWPSLDTAERLAVVQALGPIQRAIYRAGRGLPDEDGAA